MKIVRLQSQNVMRLVAVDITPTGDLVVVGGKNGAGKSSVLNSIAVALGGLALAPQEPIRAGESEAKVVVDLGEIKVTRRFFRSKVHANECASRGPIPIGEQPMTCNCAMTWSDTSSTISVTNAEGTAKYAKPQAMLDDLLGKLTFDPLAFAQDKDVKRQAETLRQLVGLNTKDVDDRRRMAAAERLRVKKDLEAKISIAASMPFHKDAPDAEVPMQAISDEMLKAEELRKLAQDADRLCEQAKDAMTAANARLGRTEVSLDEARRRVTELEAELKARGETWDEAVKTYDARKITAEAAALAVPDSSVIRSKLAAAEAMNAMVRANAARAKVEQEAAALDREHNLQHEVIVKCDEERASMIAAAKFPVDGLGVNEDGVTFGGLPFSQASTSEQLRVSVAVGLALNPKIKVLLIRNGNTLDEDSLRQVAAQAEAADAQVWVEWVTKDPEGVSVMIEDGRVAVEEEGPVHAS